MKYRIILAALGLCLSFKTKGKPLNTPEDCRGNLVTNTEELPLWFLETDLLKENTFYINYTYDKRIKPHFLQADFNNDGYKDLALPIQEISSGKMGFAIIHNQSHEVFVLGAGTQVKNGLSDNMGYIDTWKVNTKRENQPGLDSNGEINKNGPLILEYPSLQIEKSEVGGGLIYWDGKTYVYFHQTC